MERYFSLDILRHRRCPHGYAEKAWCSECQKPILEQAEPKEYWTDFAAISMNASLGSLRNDRINACQGIPAKFDPRCLVDISAYLRMKECLIKAYASIVEMAKVARDERAKHAEEVSRMNDRLFIANSGCEHLRGSLRKANDYSDGLLEQLNAAREESKKLKSQLADLITKGKFTQGGTNG